MKNFEPEEFACKCGCGRGYHDMDTQFLHLLEVTRQYADIPFVLTSAFRCPEHNRIVGGEPNGDHPNGMGVDIEAETSIVRYKIIESAIKCGFTRIGIGKKFIHLGSAPWLPQGVVWVY